MYELYDGTKYSLGCLNLSRSILNGCNEISEHGAHVWVICRSRITHVGLPTDEGADAMRHFLRRLWLQGEELHVLGEVIGEGEDVFESWGSFFQRPDQIHSHHIEGLLYSGRLKLRCLSFHFLLPLARIASAYLQENNNNGMTCMYSVSIDLEPI